MMSDYRIEATAAAAAAEQSDDVEDMVVSQAAAAVTVQEKNMCLEDMETSSSPINMNQRRKVNYTIRPEEYCIIEDNDDNNSGGGGGSRRDVDEAFSESSIQLDESVDKLSSSTSSTLSSTSYLEGFVQEMIASYPTAEQLAVIIAENYFNYAAELRQIPPRDDKVTNANDDSGVILLEPAASAQTTSGSFAQDTEEEME